MYAFFAKLSVNHSLKVIDLKKEHNFLCIYFILLFYYQFDKEAYFLSVRSIKVEF